MSYKVLLPAVVLALGIGLYIGKTYYGQSKTVEVEREVSHTDVVTVVKEVKRPDGSTETVSTTTDKSVTKKDSSTSVTLSAPAPQWHVSASAATDFKGLEPIYGLQIERRILGPFSLGVNANTQRTIGLVIGMEF